ncbi:MAG: flavin reductase family protein [Deltaproteobacteria bacterium]|jgi:flavin reductase (DIM6/NTAB) family NADH-FMN oxidoreductase RutF|nr:flavin reductase family protein [Deltaproteobacteria bacterium]
MKKSLGPNTFALPLPAFLVGSYDENGNPNLMTAAWGGILSSEPATVGVSIRPTRWTFDGITLNKSFTVNIPHVGLVTEVDFCGLVSGKQHDKFKEASLTPVESSLVKAPYVDECLLVLECKTHKTLELGSHVLFVGQILNVLADESILDESGVIQSLKANPLVYGTDAAYFKLGAEVEKAFSCGKKLLRNS